MGTYKSAISQDFGTINTTFGFDTDVFASKAYRTAARSNMFRVLSISGSPAPQEQTTSEARDNALNVISPRLHSPTALPKCTIYTLEALQRLPPVPATLKTSPLPNVSQQRIRKRRALLTRPWLVRPPSSDLSAIVDSHTVKPTVKVLMTGISESGKSTVIKSIEAAYMGAYDEQSRRGYRKMVLYNLWGCTQAIAEAVWMDENVAGNISQKVAFVASRDLLKQRNSGDIFHPNRVSEHRFTLSTDISSAIQTLWTQTQFHQVLEKSILQPSLGSSLYLIDSAK